MDARLLDEEWNFLTEFLPADWREQARHCGALRRARGVPGADCLLRLILLHTATGLSLRQTVARARIQALADISDVALLKRLRCSEAWLQWLTSTLLQVSAEEPVLQKLASRRVRVVDATTVEEQGGAGTNWRVHYTLCLPGLNCDFFELTDVHGGESYKRIPVKPGDLLLADRGYSHRAGVKAVVDAQGDVLVRLNGFIFPLLTPGGKTFDLLAHLRTLPKRGARQWAVSFEEGGQRYTGRVCALRKSALATAREKVNSVAFGGNRPIVKLAPVGHWPVPSGDPPDGTAKRFCLSLPLQNCHAITPFPVSGSPLPPILKCRRLIPQGFGVRRESREQSGHAAFAQTKIINGSLTSGVGESGVAAALCHRSP